jgi:cob(I)alamin adenosyltransferase
MVYISKVYTKFGDGGDTMLASGDTVGKDTLRVAAYGEVDELNSVLGLLRVEVSRAKPSAFGPPSSASLDATLARIQQELFDLGAELAEPGAASGKARLCVIDSDVTRLEHELDALNEHLAPLTSFILPGGGPVGATAHLARTVCRRAERQAVTLAPRRARPRRGPALPQPPQRPPLRHRPRRRSPASATPRSCGTPTAARGASHDPAPPQEVPLRIPGHRGPLPRRAPRPRPPSATSAAATRTTPSTCCRPCESSPAGPSSGRPSTTRACKSRARSPRTRSEAAPKHMSPRTCHQIDGPAGSSPLPRPRAINASIAARPSLPSARENSLTYSAMCRRHTSGSISCACART